MDILSALSELTLTESFQSSALAILGVLFLVFLFLFGIELVPPEEIGGPKIYARLSLLTIILILITFFAPKLIYYLMLTCLVIISILAVMVMTWIILKLIQYAFPSLNLEVGRLSIRHLLNIVASPFIWIFHNLLPRLTNSHISDSQESYEESIDQLKQEQK